jgi:hypothetical protein
LETGRATDRAAGGGGDDFEETMVIPVTMVLALAPDVQSEWDCDVLGNRQNWFTQKTKRGSSL